MASLRRPSQATKAQAQPARRESRPPLPADLQQKRKSKVGDRIKKRMSMRYAGTDEFLGQGAIPPLPGQSSYLVSDPYEGISMPQNEQEDEGTSRFGQFASSDFQARGFGGRGEEGIRRRGAADLSKDDEWDLDELDKEGLDVQDFVRRTLTGADEEEIKRFKAALQTSRQANAKELQRNVFRNYAEFVNMSKEIATLENDMLELKDLLNQWKDLPQLMGMEDTLAPTVDKHGNCELLSRFPLITVERRRTHRNSTADLAQLYKVQLSNLWSTVEGSQKYIPIAPGRHLVSETHSFVELNAATYKAKQNVSMFLLNDLLLIAGRRRLKSAATDLEGDRDKERERGRMVAERCWVLADLVVVDVKDSGDLTNALKIKRGKEVCVYRTPHPEDKKALLAAFRLVSQELSEKKRKESEKEQQRRKSMWQGDTATVNPNLLSPGRPVSTIGMTMSDSKDLRWIDDFGDELTMAVAMRDWEAAVSLMEKAEELKKIAAPNPTASELLDSRLSHLAPTLTTQILHDLSSHDMRKAATARLISLLTRLDHADLARDTFLSTRREVMLKRVRGIKCDGDTTIYISELAIVCFTVIRHTSDWYMSAFKENKMASGFITWTKTQIETFADLFRRQVYVPTIGEEVADECMRVVASHNRKLLRDVGLDFTFLLSSLLARDPGAQQDIPTLHPIFDISAPTPAPGYHIEPSPYLVSAETPMPSHHFDEEDTPGTAPLSFNPRSGKNPQPSLDTDTSETPASPTPPPRNARRTASGRDSMYKPGMEQESLR